MRIIITIAAIFTPLVAQASGASEAAPRAARFCEAGVPFATATTIDGDRVPLRNAALFEFLGLDLYSAAVYVPDGATTVREVLATQPKTLEIYYHRSLTAKQINRATEKALANNPTVDVDAIASQLERLYSAARNVQDGDRYRAHHADGAVQLELNGQTTAVIEGDDFAHAFFGIWLSDHALSDSLRDRLLDRTP